VAGIGVPKLIQGPPIMVCGNKIFQRSVLETVVVVVAPSSKQLLRIDISPLGLCLGTSDLLRVHSFEAGSKVNPLQSDTVRHFAFASETDLKRNPHIRLPAYPRRYLELNSQSSSGQHLNFKFIPHPRLESVRVTVTRVPVWATENVSP